MPKIKSMDGDKLLLFHEVKSIHFTFLQRLAHELRNNTLDGYISTKDFQKIFSEYFHAETPTEKKYQDNLYEVMTRQPDLRENEKGKFSTKLVSYLAANESDGYTTTIKDDGDNFPVPVPIMLTIYEKRYLKTLLQTPSFRIMASKELISVLDKYLSDVEPFDWDNLIIHRGRWERAEDIEADTARKIVQLMGVIEDGKVLVCKYRNGPMANEQQKVCPYKIMISPFTGSVQLLAKPMAEERIILMNVSELYDMEAGESHGYNEDYFYSLLESKKSKEPLVLEIRDKGNATNGIDRTFMMFSNHKKDAVYDSETGIHRIEMEYYTFDEVDIVRKMLQLGHVVTVVGPENIRTQVAATVRKALERYK